MALNNPERPSIMPMPTYLPFIQNALLDLQAIIAGANVPDTHNYASMLEQIILDEMKYEHARLSELFAEPHQPLNNIKQALLVFCKERDTENQNTVLSVSAMPNGIVNQCYWTIIQTIFEPNTLVEMLAVIAPQTQHLLSVEFKLKRAYSLGESPSTDDMQMRLIIQRLSQTPHVPCPLSLSEYVFVNDLCFDLNDIATLDIEKHIQCYELLKVKAPQLINAVYERNNDMRRLKNDMTFYQNQGQSPQQAITKLIKLLRLSGSAMTGREYAGNVAWNACTDFIRYLNDLSDELRQSLKALTALNHISTLEQTLKQLEKGECVETAANGLTYLLDDKNNDLLLKTTPIAMETKLTALKLTYQSARKEGLSLQSDSKSQLPNKWLRSVLANVKVADEDELLSLVMMLPFECYQTALHGMDFKHINKPFVLLLQYASGGILSKQQSEHLTQALINNHQRFLPSDKAIHFAARGKNISLFIGLIQTLSADECLAVLLKPLRSHNAVLPWLAISRERLVAVFNKLSNVQRKAFIEHKDFDGNTLLHHAANTHDCLSFLLDFYPIESCAQQRELMVKGTNHSGKTVLHCVNVDELSAELVLSCVNIRRRFKFIGRQDKSGNTVLHLVARNDEASEVLMVLFHSVLIEQYRLLINQQNSEGDTVLHLSLGSTQITTAILNLLPKSQRANAMVCKNAKGQTPLQNACKDTALLNIMLGALSSKKACLKVIDAIDVTEFGSYSVQKGSESLFHLLAQDEKGLNVLLERYPAKHCLTALTRKNSAGQSPLHLAVSQATCLARLLEALSLQSFQLNLPRKLMDLIDNSGNTLLHLAAEHAGSANLLLDFYPSNAHFSLVAKRNLNGESPVYMSAGSCSKTFDRMLSCFASQCTSTQSRLTRLNTRTHEGNTLFHKAAGALDCLKILITYYPMKHFPAIATAKGHFGCTALHNAHSTEVLFLLLSCIPLQARNRVIAIQSNEAMTALQEKEFYTVKKLKKLLSFFDNQGQQAILLRVKRHGSTLLHDRAASLPFLTLFLKVFPAEQHLEMFRQVDGEGTTVFRRMFQQTQNTPARLNLLKKQKGNVRLDLLYVLELLKNCFEEYISDFYQKMKQLMHCNQHCSSDELLSVLRQPLGDEGSLLDHAFYLAKKGRALVDVFDFSKVVGDYLSDLFERFKGDDYRALLQQTDSEGNTLLHLIAEHQAVEYLTIFLKRLSSRERAMALLKENHQGDSVLALAMKEGYYHNLEAAYALYPRNEYRQLNLGTALMVLMHHHPYAAQAVLVSACVLMFVFSYRCGSNVKPILAAPLPAGEEVDLVQTAYRGTFFVAKQLTLNVKAEGSCALEATPYRL